MEFVIPREEEKKGEEHKTLLSKELGKRGNEVERVMRERKGNGGKNERRNERYQAALSENNYLSEVPTYPASLLLACITCSLTV